MKILIYGLPGSGKTTLARQLIDLLTEGMGGVDEHVFWYNADRVREVENDWDFSDEGRLRQFNRMKDLANEASEKGNIVICDFVCPKDTFREEFNADYSIFMDTIIEGRFEDTNKIFERPSANLFDAHITSWEKESKYKDHNARVLMWEIFDKNFDPQHPTTQMLGRFQPWHGGHQALFNRALDKTGQVYLMIRNTPVDEKNPYPVTDRIAHLKMELAAYAGMVRIEPVPNITHISYGRKVGYTIEQEHFSEEIENISATKIREGL